MDANSPLYWYGLPVVVWTGVISSAITLSGVLLADRRNTIRQKRQHDFDATQKKLDRANNLKKELYLPMIDILIKAMDYFLYMPTLKFNGRELIEQGVNDTPWTELDSALSKLKLISDISTVVLAEKLSNCYSDIHAELSKAAAPYRHSQMMLQGTSLQMADLESNFESVTKVLETRVESGMEKDKTWHELVDRQEKFLNALEASQENHQKALVSDQAEHLNYQREVAKFVPELQNLILELIIAMRSELTSEADSSVLLAELKHQLKRDRARVKDTLEQAAKKES